MKTAKTLMPTFIAIAALAYAATALAAPPDVTATVDGTKVTGTYRMAAPSYVVGFELPPPLRANVVSLSCPGARAQPGGPGGSWECLFSSQVSSTPFTMIGQSAWPANFIVKPFESHDNATYVIDSPVEIGATPAPKPTTTASGPGETVAAPVTSEIVTPGSSLTWLWITVLGLGIAITTIGLWPRESMATEVEPPELRWGQDEKLAIDEGILAGFAGMGKQDTPHTVSDDVGPGTLNPDTPVAPYVAPSAAALAAERQWEQDRALERDTEDDWRHHVHRTPNAGLQELYDKLAQVNDLITGLEGPQADTVAAQDPLLTAWQEATDFNLTAYDPLEHAYKMREQLMGLIQLYQGKGGADAVNQAISDQKLEYLVNTVRMESDMAQGTAIAGTSGALTSTQAGYAPPEGSKVAPGEQGGKSEAAPEPETGLAPEPETVKMTPAEQGITPGTSESPTVRTVDEIGLPQAVGSVEEVGIEAHHNEKVFKGGDAYGKKVYGRYLQDQPPEWWDNINDPNTKSYLQSILNGLK